MNINTQLSYNSKIYHFIERTSQFLWKLTKVLPLQGPLSRHPKWQYSDLHWWNGDYLDHHWLQCQIHSLALVPRWHGDIPRQFFHHSEKTQNKYTHIIITKEALLIIFFYWLEFICQKISPNEFLKLACGHCHI